jgi:hypothetical protein
MTDGYKNIYNYNLNEMKDIVVNKKGEIIAVFERGSGLKNGDKFRFPNGGGNLKVVDTKKVIVVEEV